MPRVEFDFEVLLLALVERGVHFIVVGGVCAAIYGAPGPTFDLDIVPSRDPANLERLAKTLHALKAYYREHPPGRIVPEAKRLDTPGHHLLMTMAGPLDVLGTLVGGRGYEDLLPHTIEVELREGMWIRILDLPTLIQIKQETGRERDRAVLPILRRALEEIERIKGDAG